MENGIIIVDVINTRDLLFHSVNWRWLLWLSQCQRSINFNLIMDFTVSLPAPSQPFTPQGIVALPDNKFPFVDSNGTEQESTLCWQIMTGSDGKLNGKALVLMQISVILLLGYLSRWQMIKNLYSTQSCIIRIAIRSFPIKKSLRNSSELQGKFSRQKD